jgi:hypothetical protein
MSGWIHETGWAPGFNDPTLLGWATTAGYLFAVALGFILMARAKKNASPISRFWSVFSVVFLLLGLNKQLDLQTLLLKTASEIASSLGFYEMRHLIRVGFVTLAGIFVLAGFLWLFAKRRVFLPRDPFLWIAIGLVFVFVLIRTSAFDGILRLTGLGLERNRGAHHLELAGVICLNAALLRHFRRGGS